MNKKKFFKVSIIIPVYNGEDYLKEAIDSALSQTYDNFEIIVVNDGSTDGTEKIAKSYGNLIRYYKKKNGGVASALNLGIKKMKGDFFSWLSHDDRYFPEKLEIQVDLITQIEDKNTVIYSDYGFIDENGDKYLQPLVFNHEELNANPLKALYYGCLNGITMLIPKKAFDICGYFNSDYRTTQDYDMWRRMIRKLNFYHSNIVVTETRLHKNQDSNKNPYAIQEANKLWISLIKEITTQEITHNFGSYYLFIRKMNDLMICQPYYLASAYCQKELINLEIDSNCRIQKTTILILFVSCDNLEKDINRIKQLKEINNTNIRIRIYCKNDSKKQLLSIFSEQKNIIESVVDLGTTKTIFDYKSIKEDFALFFIENAIYNSFIVFEQARKTIINNVNVSIKTYIRNECDTSCIVNSPIEFLISQKQFYFPLIMFRPSAINNSTKIYFTSKNEDNLLNIVLAANNKPILIIKESSDFDFKNDFKSENSKLQYLINIWDYYNDCKLNCKTKYNILNLIMKEIKYNYEHVQKEVEATTFFQKKLEDTESIIDSINNLNTELKNINEQTKNENMILSNDLKKIINSKSWKITQPLRTIIKAVKKISKKEK